MAAISSMKRRASESGGPLPKRPALYDKHAQDLAKHLEGQISVKQEKLHALNQNTATLREEINALHAQLAEVRQAAPTTDPRRTTASLRNNAIRVLREVHSRNTHMKMKACMDLLQVYMDNFLSDPEDMTMWKIKATNKAVQERICSLDHGENLLLAAGFVKEVFEFQEFYFICPPSIGYAFFNCQEKVEQMSAIYEGLLSERHRIEAGAAAEARQAEAAVNEPEQRLQVVRQQIADDRRERQGRREQARTQPPGAGAPRRAGV